MKTLIIYVSIYQGNTRKIAEVMAETLDATILEPEEVEVSSLDNYNLIGLGAGVYWGRLYKRLRNFVKGLPVLQDKKVFLFSANGHGEPLFRSIEKRLQNNGYDIVGKFSCLGYSTFFLAPLMRRQNKGKPDSQDLQRAREFAESLKR